jgi:uncharacterized membrane protein
VLNLRAALRDRHGAGDSARADGVRWRGHDVSRLEGLTDAVFAFAITLLVVSLEVPRSFDELMLTMQGFGAFAASFAILALIWYFHYRFFREYGLVDGTVIVLNLVLLFVILFYTFPLKFLFGVLINFLLLQHGLGVSMGFEAGIGWHQMHLLMIVYGVGFVMVFLIFALLYLHAYRMREALGLDAAEAHATWSGVQANLICVATGLASILVALVGGPAANAFSGWVYAAIGPLQWLHARQRARDAGGLAAPAA